MILWFANISPDGQRLVGENPATSGYSCHWLDDVRYIGKVGNGPGLRVDNVPAFSDWPEPNAISAGGGGRFACDYWPGGLRLSDPDPLSPDGSTWIKDGFASTIADDGYLAYLTGHDTPAQTVVRDEFGHVYDSGAPMEYPNASRQGVVWTKYTGRDQHSKETWGAQRGGAKQRLHASGVLTEFGPISVDTPRNGLWVAAFRHDGVVLYPWGSTVGYFYLSTNARAVHAKWDPVTNRIYVVWNRPDGTLEERRQDLSLPRVPLELVAPPPPPPPQGNAMELPREIHETYRQVAEKFADLHRSSNDRDRAEANARGVATIRARHRGTGPLDGLRYVCKSEHANGWAASSKDALGYVNDRVDASAHGREMDMFMFDMISGSSRAVNAHPIRADNREPGEKHNPTAFVLIPEAKDWLANGPVDPPPPVDPGDPNKPIGRDVKHKWWRGDDEPRDDCNREMIGGGDCDRGKDDPIHQVPAQLPGGGDGGDPGDEDPPTKPPTGEPTNAQLLAAINNLTARFNAVYK